MPRAHDMGTTIERVLLWLQAALCVLVVITLSLSAIQTYTSGVERRATDPTVPIFTPESAAAAIVDVLPYVLAGLVLTVFCHIHGIRDKRFDKLVSNAEVTRDLSCVRVSVPTDAMVYERVCQRRANTVSWTATIACLVPIALFLSDSAHFASTDVEGLETMVTGVVANVCPWALLAVSIRAVTYALKDKSMERETALAKERVKEEKAAGVTVQPKTPTMGAESLAQARLYRMVTAAIAVILIVLGILNGSAEDVLIKAIEICTECIGLG